MQDNYKVLINQGGQMVELFVSNDSFQIEQSVNDFSRCQLSAVDFDNRVSALRKGLRIEVYRKTSLVFSGVLNGWTKRDIGVDGIEFLDLQILGNEYILQKRVLRNRKEYGNQTVKQAVTKILADAKLDSVTVGDIENNVQIGDLKNDFNFVADLFNQIADDTESYWWIDQSRKLYFIPIDDTRSATRTLTYNDTVGERPQIKVANEKKITRVVFSDYYETGTSRRAAVYTDGNKREFTIAHPVYEILNVKLKLLDGTFVRNVTATMKHDLSELDMDAVSDEDFEADRFAFASEIYWSRGDNKIYQSNATNPQQFGFYFDITYRPLLAKAYVYTDADAVAELANDTMTSGIVDEIYSETVYGKDAADKIAKQIIKFNAKRSEEVTFNTLRDDLNAGDVVELTLDEYGINNRKYIVSNMTYTQATADTVMCSLVLARGVLNRDWSKFFAEGTKKPSSVKKKTDAGKPVYAGNDANADLYDGEVPSPPENGGGGSGGGDGGSAGEADVAKHIYKKDQDGLVTGKVEIYFRKY